MKFVFAIVAVFALGVASAAVVSVPTDAHAGCPTHDPNCNS